MVAAFSSRHLLYPLLSLFQEKIRNLRIAIPQLSSIGKKVLYSNISQPHQAVPIRCNINTQSYW